MSAYTKFGLLSFISAALAAPLAQPYDELAPNAWWSVPAIVTPANYPKATTTVSVASSSSSAAFSAASATAAAASGPSSYVALSVLSSPSPVEAAAVSTPASAATASATKASSSSVKSSSGSKRGLPYNDASFTDPFAGSKVSWAYNWGHASSGLDESKFEFVPQLWGTGSLFTTGWKDDASSAISNGAKNLLGFNEPDIAKQANLSPEDAADGWTTYMEPFAGKARLGSPAVSNAAAPQGVAWLTDFIAACKTCTIDFAVVHWYDSFSNVEYFKQFLTDAHEKTGKPVWLTEFGCNDGSDEDISGFLSEVLPWMDEQDWIERYSYFMAKDGKLNSGSDMSAYGKTYATV